MTAWPLLTLAFLILLAPSPGHAQTGSVATGFDPSVSSSGMGGATVAAFWLDQPNVWINPALASFQRGITYSYGTTKPIPAFNDEIKFQSHQILLGAHGIGVEVTGKPVESLGKLRVDYGPSEISDIEGNVIGEVDAYEEVRTFAVGVDLVRLFASFQEASSGKPSEIGRRLSIAVGHAWKKTKLDLGFTAGEEEVEDLGALVRVAPLDQIGVRLGEASSETRWRLEVAGGYAEQDYNEPEADEIIIDLDYTHYGASLRLTVAPPTTGEGWLLDFGSPAIGIGLAWTRRDEEQSRATNLFGAEASLWDIVYLRGGYVDENFGDGEVSCGAGVALRYRHAIGARFDYARFPQGDIEDNDIDRYQVTAFLDPVLLWRELR